MLWFLNTEGRVQGPYSETQLLEMARRGTLTASDAVSPDQRTWMRAALIPGLFSPQAVAQSGPARPLPNSTPAAPTAALANTNMRRSSGGILGMMVSVLIGGAAAVYVATHFKIVEKLIRGRGETNVTLYEAPPAAGPTATGKQIRPATDASVRRTASSISMDVGLSSVESTPNAPLGTATPPAESISMSVQTEPAPTPPRLEPTKPDWAQQLDTVYARLPGLRAQYEQIAVKLKPTIEQLELSQDRLQFVQRAGSKLRSDYAVLNRNIQSLLQRRQLSDASLASAIDSEIRAIRSRQSSISDQYGALDAEAATLKSRCTTVMAEIDSYRDQLAPVVAEGKRIEATLMDVLDPLGKSPCEDAAAMTKYFDDAIQSHRGDDNSLAHFGRGCIRLRLSDPLAFADFDDAVRLAPKQAMVLAVRGVAAIAAGREQDGRSDLSAATKLDPNHGMARSYYAVALLRSGANSTAETQLRDAMKANPQDPEAYRVMALYKATSDVAAQRSAEFALKNAEIANSIANGKSWRSLMALAAAHAENGAFKIACRYAEDAGKLAPASMQPWCQSCFEMFRDDKPLRINWKTFELWSSL